MKRNIPVIIFLLLAGIDCLGQDMKNTSSGFLFHGLVVDSGTEIPLSNTQIFINRSFSAISDNEGKFAFYVSRYDTIHFRRLGFKATSFIVSDTLSGSEFLAGIFMNPDTISIGEVVIIPRLSNLKSDMFAPRNPADAQTEYAKYNLAVSAYQGRVNQGKTGNPSANYEVLRQVQRDKAYSKGQLSSDQMVGISPLLLIPAAYLLMNGLPEKPPALQPRISEQEIYQLHKKYLKSKQGK
jgi:hypothetical protein